MVEGDITDPIEGIAHANMHIRKLESLIEEAKLAGDYQNAIRGEGWLVKWEEKLQYWIHQAHQMGKTTEDVTTAIKKLKDTKGRYNA
jgi:hypothetical protein